MAQKPEVSFGSNVAVWVNRSEGGQISRSISISPRRYKDKDGTWKEASGWNVSDVAHLAVCLSEAVLWCLRKRANEDYKSERAKPQEDAPPPADFDSSSVPTGELPF